MTYKTKGRRPQPFQFQLPGGVDVATLSGTHQLTAQSGNLQRLDPNGSSRNVDLPGPNQGIANNSGLAFLIMNAAAGANNLVVRNPAGATVVTLNQNERALVVGTGGAAWTHMGVETIALT